MTDQGNQLARVASEIAETILHFAVQTGTGETFHIEELLRYVRAFEPNVAPDSPGRILRHLRQSRRLGYRVINRRLSLYEFTFTPVLHD